MNGLIVLCRSHSNATHSPNHSHIDHWPVGGVVSMESETYHLQHITYIGPWTWSFWPNWIMPCMTGNQNLSPNQDQDLQCNIKREEVQSQSRGSNPLPDPNGQLCFHHKFLWVSHIWGNESIDHYFHTCGVYLPGHEHAGSLTLWRGEVVVPIQWRNSILTLVTCSSNWISHRCSVSIALQTVKSKHFTFQIRELSCSL